MFFIKNNSKLYNFLKFFFSYPIQNSIILNLILSFFYNFSIFFFIIDVDYISIFITFFFEFFMFFFNSFFIFNAGCLLSILFIELKKKKDLKLYEILLEKNKKYLYNFLLFFLFFIFIIFCYYFIIFLFFFCEKIDIILLIILIIIIVFFFYKNNNIQSYYINNIDNYYIKFNTKSLFVSILISFIYLFTISINLINNNYINFFIDFFIFNAGCILSILFLNLNENKELIEKQQKYVYYLFYFFLLYEILFIIIFYIIFFYKSFFFIILNNVNSEEFLNLFKFGIDKSIIFFHFYIDIYIFYYFLNLFLSKNKYDFNFIKNICIYIFFFCIFCILLFCIIFLFKYLLSLIIINVYAMEDNVINEEDKNEIKKSIKNNNLIFQKVNITNNREYFGSCISDMEINNFLNFFKKECEKTPLKNEKLVIVDVIVPIKKYVCAEMYDFGFFIKDNMLHIDDSRCYTYKVKKKEEKIFNINEND